MLPDEWPLVPQESSLTSPIASGTATALGHGAVFRELMGNMALMQRQLVALSQAQGVPLEPGVADAQLQGGVVQTQIFDTAVVGGSAAGVASSASARAVAQAVAGSAAQPGPGCAIPKEFLFPLLVVQMNDNHLCVSVICPVVPIKKQEECPGMVRMPESKEEPVTDDPLPLLLKVEHGRPVEVRVLHESSGPHVVL